MTANDLLEKLHECRDNMEGSTDDLAQSTFDTLNQLIYDLENDGVDSNDGYRRVYQGGY